MLAEFLENGYILRESLFSKIETENLRDELVRAIDREAEFHGNKTYRDYGMLLAAPIYGGAILGLAGSDKLFAVPDAVLGETCIIHVYTSSSLPPHATNYGTRVHRERSEKYPNILDFMGVLILLDDFSEANGATWYLPGSHKLSALPDEKAFYREARRLIAPAGSVYYFDWRLCHAGGENSTAAWRHALAMGITPAYHKQKVDLPRAIPAHFAAGLSDFARQKLGYFSTPPVSLKEYYAPENERPYRQKPI